MNGNAYQKRLFVMLRRLKNYLPEWFFITKDSKKNKPFRNTFLEVFRHSTSKNPARQAGIKLTAPHPKPQETLIGGCACTYTIIEALT